MVESGQPPRKSGKPGMQVGKANLQDELLAKSSAFPGRFLTHEVVDEDVVTVVVRLEVVVVSVGLPDGNDVRSFSAKSSGAGIVPSNSC